MSYIGNKEFYLEKVVFTDTSKTADIYQFQRNNAIDVNGAGASWPLAAQCFDNAGVWIEPGALQRSTATDSLTAAMSAAITGYMRIIW